VKSTRSILALMYTPVSVAGGVRKAVGGFLRYVQFRDQHVEPEAQGGFDAYVRYVAHRDRTSPGGRIFGHDGRRSDGDRRRLVDYVARSIKGLAPKWVRARDGTLEDRQRAFYQFVLSPEEWRGLNLRRLARAAMERLEADAGPLGLGPWFAAEHRNTAHHHVHIVLAARRENEPGNFRTLLITRRRLERMKDAIGNELVRQRGQNTRWEHPLTWARLQARSRPRGHPRHLSPTSNWLQGLACSYRTEAERMARKRSWASDDEERGLVREREWPG